MTLVNGGNLALMPIAGLELVLGIFILSKLEDGC